ncbi:hypothetical protein SARC_04245 [Sphaeroforma arctica JP610]|uniref:RNA 2-O ribose methyltransferase substrate binding domain-containing protein n=1 Tax=Sphaeroforma arctica JP610 TaxID=667725 RepID=A0A0L0G3T0_9EUKA|nr:hypothetical protein SARC_04245 [Sphaeroforma arctica JP610]KNC83514.1 hypothetical protein SARC_04245 [Sphaeroforma arctica JP610]|eukprot:XP_014157416.1 hypothetical protein SARC_04245 [Sphaeroforma arctica JP610]
MLGPKYNRLSFGPLQPYSSAYVHRLVPVVATGNNTRNQLRKPISSNIVRPRSVVCSMHTQQSTRAFSAVPSTTKGRLPCYHSICSVQTDGSVLSRHPRRVHNETSRQMSGIAGYGEDELVFGLASVTNALTSKRRRIYHAYIVDNWWAKPDSKEMIGKVIEFVEADGVAVSYVSKGKLHSLSENKPHQGVVLVTSTLEFEPIQELEAWTGSGKRLVYLV